MNIISIEPKFRASAIKYSKYIAISLFVLFCLLLIFEQGKAIDSIENSLNAMSKSKNTVMLTTSGLTETDAYKLMYENLKYSNDKILDTIYWALSGIVVAIFALLGTNVFFNYRFNKNEVEVLKTDFTANVEKIKNSCYKEIQEKLKEALNCNKNDIREDFKQLSHTQQSQINSIVESINSKVEALKTTTNNQISTIESGLSTFKNESKNVSKDTLNRISLEHKLSEIGRLGLEAEIWDLKGIGANAVIMNVRKATLQLELGKSIDNTLNNIIGILKISKHMMTHYQNEVSIFIDKIPKEYDMQKENIVNMVKNLPLI